MFDELKEQIIKNTNNRRPDMSEYWSLIQDIESLVPKEIFKPRMKGYIKKAARILFVSECLGRYITSFKQLNAGEIYLVNSWFYGKIGQTSDVETNKEINDIMLVAWWCDNAVKIQATAQRIRQSKLKKK